MSGPLDGKTWEFEQEIVIGRDDAVAGACITLDRYISRKHALLRGTGDHVVLADLSSRNGTKVVDGRAVTTETRLPLGERFVVGRTHLRVFRQ
ncbi:MAG TPA: FHA domain-containing protein [Candidatus Baltobacteraceae bacterium]